MTPYTVGVSGTDRVTFCEEDRSWDALPIFGVFWGVGGKWQYYVVTVVTNSRSESIITVICRDQ